MASKQNYTLGRGELHFARFKDTVNLIPGGERYIGNSPELTWSASVDNLDHFSSDEGIKEKDDSIPLQVDRTGSFTTDNVVPANLALFWFGTSELVVTTAASSQAETFNDVEPGLSYQLGTTNANPAGARNVSTVVVTDGASGTPVTFTEGEDYTVDTVLGRITVIEGGAIEDTMAVTYAIAASTRERVMSGSQPVEGSLRYIAKNPKGDNIDYFFPWVSLTPNGDYALKGDDWQTIPFNIEIKKKPGLEAVYADGRPLAAP